MVLEIFATRVHRLKRYFEKTKNRQKENSPEKQLEVHLKPKKCCVLCDVNVKGN